MIAALPDACAPPADLGSGRSSPPEVPERLARATAAVADALRALEAMSLPGAAPRTTLDTCHRLVGVVRDSLPLSGLGVFLGREDAADFTLEFCVPAIRASRVQSEFERQIESGALGRALSERRQVVCPPLSRGLPFEETRSVIILPIASPRRVYGILFCLAAEPPEAHTLSVLRVLQITANQAAMAIENFDLRRTLDESSRVADAALVRRAGALLKEKEAIEAAYAEMQQRDKAKDEFLSFVGHELRAPLASLLSFVEFLQDGGLSMEEIKELAGPVHHELTRLNRLVTDILDLARLEAGRVTYMFVKGDLNRLAEQCVKVMEVAAHKRGMTIEFQPQADLPLVLLEPDRIEQVITNMLSNAIKFSEDGGRILVRTEDRPGEVFLSVQDFGAGIAARDLPRVFNRFERIETPGKKVPGTGFGMPLSKNIIEVGHKGRMWVVSEGRSSGSTFFFTLPKKR